MHDRDLSAVTEADMAKSKADMANDSRGDMGRGNGEDLGRGSKVDTDEGSRVDPGEGKVDMDVGETVRGELVMAVLIENAGRYLVDDQNFSAHRPDEIRNSKYCCPALMGEC